MVNMDDTDIELLAAFARQRREDAFRELVRRHLPMVFATARRLLEDTHQAEEVSQSVFQLLASKAGVIDGRAPLAGWLYHATRHQALHLVRSEGRRRQREQRAAAMQVPTTASPAEGELIAELEEALTALSSDERDVLVLRFLEDRRLSEVGHELGVSEEAARKRVTRALDRLREIFGRRGLGATPGAITVALVGQSAVGVPAGLGAGIINTALAGTAAAAAATSLTQGATAMSLFNLKTAAAVLTAAAVTGTSTYLIKERGAERLRAEQASLAAAHATLTTQHEQEVAAVHAREEQIAQLQKEVAELPRLRGEVDRLNRTVAALRNVEAELTEARRLLAEARESQTASTEGAAEAGSNKEPTNVGTPDEYDEVFLVRYGLWNEEAEKKAAIARMNQYRQIGLGLIMYADKQKGWFPSSLEMAKGFFPEELKTKGVELVYTGDIASLRAPANTILAKQEYFSKAADGNGVWKVYVFADGHSELRRGATEEELLAWESERIVPPELQSR